MGGCQVPYVRRPQALSCRFLGIALLPVVAALVHHPGEKREPPCLSFVGALEAQRTNARCPWSEGAPWRGWVLGSGAFVVGGERVQECGRRDGCESPSSAPLCRTT